MTLGIAQQVLAWGTSVGHEVNRRDCDTCTGAGGDDVQGQCTCTVQCPAVGRETLEDLSTFHGGIEPFRGCM